MCISACGCAFVFEFVFVFAFMYFCVCVYIYIISAEIYDEAAPLLECPESHNISGIFPEVGLLFRFSLLYNFPGKRLRVCIHLYLICAYIYIYI